MGLKINSDGNDTISIGKDAKPQISNPFGVTAQDGYSECCDPNDVWGMGGDLLTEPPQSGT
jgi:hypothetical protein